MSELELSAGVPDTIVAGELERRRAARSLPELLKRAEGGAPAAVDEYRAALLVANRALRACVCAGVAWRTFADAGLTARALGYDADPARDGELAAELAGEQQNLVLMCSRFQSVYKLSYLLYLAREIPALDTRLSRLCDVAAWPARSSAGE